MGDIAEWFKGLPIFTRYWFGLSVATALVGKLRLLDPYYLVLYYQPLVHSFQFWRPVTALFYYPITPRTGFHYLVNLYFLYSYSLRLETGLFDGRPADYFFMLIFNWLCCVIVALLAEIPLLMDPMVMSVLYVWCQVNKDMIVSFWFGTQFKAMYLPWVLLVFNLVVAGGGVMELVGIIVGHLYHFLMFKYPQEFGGPNLLSTPQIMYRWFPSRRGGTSGFGQAPASRRADNVPRAGRHQWGQGHVLGGN